MYMLNINIYMGWSQYYVLSLEKVRSSGLMDEVLANYIYEMDLGDIRNIRECVFHSTPKEMTQTMP